MSDDLDTSHPAFGKFREPVFTPARIAYVAGLAVLFLIVSYGPGIVQWAEENPWVAYPPVIGYLALSAWLFPGLHDADDAIDVFLDD